MRFSKTSFTRFVLLTIVALSACVTEPGDYSTGGISCFGGCFGTYSYPGPKVSLVPSPVAGGLTFKAISLGSQHVCGVTTAGDAYCWGALNFGSDAYRQAAAPERVPGDTKFDTISVGNGSACAIATDKRTMCWGTNDAGQLGNGFYGPPALVPTAVLAPGVFKSIAVGGWDVGGSDGTIHSAFACGATAAGAVYCWGTNSVGQLGSGVATTNVLFVAPSPIAGDRTFTSLAGTGFASACGLESGGAAYCWGRNSHYDFGNANGGIGPLPPTRVAGDLSFVALSTGGGTCGITTTGDTYCWGTSGITGESGTTPRLITSIPFVSIAAGGEHACGLTANGTAYCWGSNGSGQLGNGMTTMSPVPVLVATDLRFVRISAGINETCAVASDGAAYCWGSDGFWGSMLGRGT